MQNGLHNTNTDRWLSIDATAERRTSSTDASGGYQFVSLTPDNYKLDMEGAGFEQYPRDPITVQVDRALCLNATVGVGAVCQQLVVTSQAPIMQAEMASLGQLVPGKGATNISGEYQGYWPSLWLRPLESTQKRIGSALGPSIEVSEPILDSEVSHVEKS
jgi:hypothetical protein